MRARATHQLKFSFDAQNRIHTAHQVSARSEPATADPPHLQLRDYRNKTKLQEPSAEAQLLPYYIIPPHTLPNLHRTTS